MADKPRCPECGMELVVGADEDQGVHWWCDGCRREWPLREAE